MTFSMKLEIIYFAYYAKHLTAFSMIGSASENVTQTVEYVEQNDKLDHLMRFLLTIQEGLILVFTETKRNCDFVEDILCERGFPACSIHGDKSQREREDALRNFKTGRCPVLVATDVSEFFDNVFK